MFMLQDPIMTKDLNVIGDAKSASFDAFLESAKFRLQGAPDQLLLRHQQGIAPRFTNFEPTPIAPSGVATVSTLPLERSLLSSDLSQINILQQLFSPAQLQAHQQIVQSAQLSPDANNCFPALARSSTPSIRKEAKVEKVKYGPRHIEQWNMRFQELVDFQKEHGHCLVPMYDHASPKLSNWVKRQRNQYRLKIEGKHSTLCDKRQKALEDLGFVWDSHAACWDERYKELVKFFRENGHSKVPKSYKKNPSLSVWVKCQRRQFKLLQAGKPSYISEDRIRLLSELNFDFNPRRDSIYSQARGKV
ncbi:unnamed protein product [Cylindrotheca closterium]|uniref:Helicase-associated domain-containing protein n=1 Tax=Cylindrotheca closterium TaxID=2856 RepID=A0AAD2CKM1_9STRA|nr:unnamed protein product [Cylindrotheca closterium]